MLSAKDVMLWIVVDATSFDPSDQRPDEIVWTRTATGEYSVRSAYQMQFQGSIDSNLKTLIWHVWVLLRCKFFIWLMLQNQVWMADRLLLCKWPNEYFCPLCIHNLETVAHLLMECVYSPA
jgi:hypothetical protein